MLRTKRHALNRQQMKAVSAAFEVVCDALDIRNGREDQLAAMARRLINLADAGVCDPRKLSAIALAEFGVANDGSRWPH